MIKVIGDNAWQGDLWDEENPRVALVKYASNGISGLDKQAFVKRASEETSEELLKKVAQMEVKPGEELVHLIAMGTTEAYGPNRNGDGFSKKACIQYHPTFVKHARFYRNHKNKDPQKSYGIVKASAYNPAMSRIELIVALNGNEKAAKANGGLVADKEMEKLASGEDIAVSMACLTDPEYPILTKENGYIPIKDIVPGLSVWTKDSGWKKVVSINRRKYTGNVYNLHMTGLPFPLEITADHPLWVKHFEGDSKRAFKNPEEFEKTDSGWLVAEKIEPDDRVFYKPISKFDDFAAIDDENLAAIMGYYLAEGCISVCKRNPNTINFICNLADSLPRRLPAFINAMYPEITVKINPHRCSKDALVVSVYSAALAKYINTLIGKGCRTKVVPPEIFNARDEVKKAFIGAWLDGDGWVDNKGGHISTVSSNLALQARDLFALIDIPSSIYKIDHTKCNTSGKENSGVEYSINISKCDLYKLDVYSEKVSNSNPEKDVIRKKPACMRACADGLFAYRIKEISSRYVENITTYNFEVEDDPSYSAAGIISHNCSVPFDVCSCCGNKATTREEYCKGIDEGGKCEAGGLSSNICKFASVNGKIKQLYADNTQPDFFDISNVFIPADRIAYSSGLLKHASYSTNGYKPTMYEKESAYTIDYDPDVPYALTVLQDTILDFRAMEEEGLKKMASTVGWQDARPLYNTQVPDNYLPGNTYKVLADMSICLPASQFIQLTQHCPFEKAAQVGQVVAPLSNSAMLYLTKNDTRHNPYKPSEGAPDSLYSWVCSQDLTPVRPDAWLKQAAYNYIDPTPVKLLSKRKLTKMAEDEWIKEAAYQYALYKVAFLQSQPEEDIPLMAELITARDYVPCVN